MTSKTTFTASDVLALAEGLRDTETRAASIVPPSPRSACSDDEDLAGLTEVVSEAEAEFVPTDAREGRTSRRADSPLAVRGTPRSSGKVRLAEWGIRGNVVSTPLSKHADAMVIAIGVPVGSRHEEPGEQGIAHFLEHMVCQTSVKKKTGLMHHPQVITANAATGFAHTVYHVAVRADPDIALEIFDHLFSAILVEGPDFDSPLVHSEPFVVRTEEEFRSRESLGVVSAALEATGVHLPIGHRDEYGHDAAEKARKFWEENYRFNKDAVVVLAVPESSGGEEAEALIRQHIRDIDDDRSPLHHPQYARRPHSPDSAHVLGNDLAVSSPMVRGPTMVWSAFIAEPDRANGGRKGGLTQEQFYKTGIAAAGMLSEYMSAQMPGHFASMVVPVEDGRWAFCVPVGGGVVLAAAARLADEHFPGGDQPTPDQKKKKATFCEGTFQTMFKPWVEQSLKSAATDKDLAFQLSKPFAEARFSARLAWASPVSRAEHIVESFLATHGETIGDPDGETPTADGHCIRTCLLSISERGMFTRVNFCDADPDVSFDDEEKTMDPLDPADRDAVLAHAREIAERIAKQDPLPSHERHPLFLRRHGKKKSDQISGRGASGIPVTATSMSVADQGIGAISTRLQLGPYSAHAGAIVSGLSRARGAQSPGRGNVRVSFVPHFDGILITASFDTKTNRHALVHATDEVCARVRNFMDDDANGRVDAERMANEAKKARVSRGAMAYAKETIAMQTPMEAELSVRSGIFKEALAFALTSSARRHAWAAVAPGHVFDGMALPDCHEKLMELHDYANEKKSDVRYRENAARDIVETVPEFAVGALASQIVTNIPREDPRPIPISDRFDTWPGALRHVAFFFAEWDGLLGTRSILGRARGISYGSTASFALLGPGEVDIAQQVQRPSRVALSGAMTIESTAEESVNEADDFDEYLLDNIENHNFVLGRLRERLALSAVSPVSFATSIATGAWALMTAERDIGTGQSRRVDAKISPA